MIYALDLRAIWLLPVFGLIFLLDRLSFVLEGKQNACGFYSNFTFHAPSGDRQGFTFHGPSEGHGPSEVEGTGVSHFTGLRGHFTGLRGDRGFTFHGPSGGQGFSRAFEAPGFHRVCRVAARPDPWRRKP